MVSAVVFNASKPRVMILQSYDAEYPWTRDIDVGLQRIIDHWNDYSVVWHYMDTKKYNDPKWLERSGIVARRAIKSNQPHVLIAVDDLAQKLAAKYFVDDPNIQIVFAGINGSEKQYGYDVADNVTGIFERKQLSPVRETIMALEANKAEPSANPKLAYIMDPSASLKSGRSMVDNFSWGPIEYKGSFVANSYPEWQQLITEKNTEVDYIIVANYRKLIISDKSKTFANPVGVVTWTEANTNIPVIGINSFNVEDGMSISIGVSPFEQGEVAAKMAEMILEKEKIARDIPMVKSKQYVVAIRESGLMDKGMKLPAIYEAFGRATDNYIENNSD